MAKLKIENGKLVVPNNITIPYIAGDGVGAEISPVTQSIIDTAVKKCYAGERKIEWLEVLAGEKAFKQTGSWLPEETMRTFREYLIGIKAR